MRNSSAVLAFTATLFASAVCVGSASAQDAGRQFGVSAGLGVAGAPLGEVAASYGLVAIPGAEYDIRLFTRSVRGNEWSIGVLGDQYRVRHVTGMPTPSEFEFSSTALLVGRYWAQHIRGAPVRVGLDLGWRSFTAAGSRPDAYTGEVHPGTVRGGGALLGVAYGVELSPGSSTVTPRLRLETSYPDFGGGDGYSRLHRESDLGFRASVGVELRQSVTRR
jgi:hypothetical protein